MSLAGSPAVAQAASGRIAAIRARPLRTAKLRIGVLVLIGEPQFMSVEGEPQDRPVCLCAGRQLHAAGVEGLTIGQEPI
jgi:hypothetical protein